MCKIKDSIIDKPIDDSEYIAPLNELQNKILKSFYDLQCNEESGIFNDDETPVIRYDELVSEFKLDKSRIKPEILDLRNRGLIYLGMCVDWDRYAPSGSGYMLTERGAELVKQMFFKEKSICCDAEIVDGRCFNCKENVN